MKTFPDKQKLGTAANRSVLRGMPEEMKVSGSDSKPYEDIKNSAKGDYIENDSSQYYCILGL